MKNIKYILVFVIAIITMSCSNSKPVVNTSGTIAINITDAPMHYDQFMEVNVTIDKIEIGNSADMNSFILISNMPMTFNMLNLVNGITDTMAQADIPEGTYNTIRLSISSAQMVLKDGTSFSYNMNQNGYSNGGMMQNGMTLNSANKSVDITMSHDLNFTTGTQMQFLLDIDIDHSFDLQGVSFMGMGSGMMMSMTGFHFFPVMRFVDMETAGTISGTVHSDQGDLSDVTISLMQNGQVYTTTHTNTQGKYSFIGIPNGMYTMTAAIDGYTMSQTGNDANMGTIQMTDHGSMTIDFNMMSSTSN